MSPGYLPSDTIVAIATPQGRGGIGVVRLSGAQAHAIALALVGREPPLEPRHATFARIVDSGGPAAAADRVVDQVVVTLFESPQSYTGDDVVEISGHGNPVLLGRIVSLATGHGARLAEPGEFTFRAYLNGRLDLAQAEAVADVVDAVTPLQARAAMDQLEGTLTTKLAAIDAALFDLTARLEASLDFPDEGFHFVTREGAREDVRRIGRDLDALASDGRAGRVIREGRLVVIAGPPNAGKSSLFNALAGAARAIVTEIPGTTRDVLTEQVDIDGVLVTLIDTAGLRDATDAIEAEGVSRARQAQRVAALTLMVFDGSIARPADADAIRGGNEGARLLVVSKADLPPAWAPPEGAVSVSARTGAGLPCLRKAIVTALTAREDLRDPPAITNIRHLELVDAARDALSRAAAGLAEGATEELILDDLGAARRTLEQVTGRRTPDDVLRHIFAKFCVGK